jgi:hypothetical protein
MTRIFSSTGSFPATAVETSIIESVPTLDAIQEWSAQTVSAAARSAASALISLNAQITCVNDANTSTVNAGIARTNADKSSNNAAIISAQAAVIATQYTDTIASSLASVLAANSAGLSNTNIKDIIRLFQSKYLGAFSSVPTLDNNGDMIKQGAEYFNLTESRVFLYNGTAWVDYTGVDQVALASAASASAAASVDAISGKILTMANSLITTQTLIANYFALN